MADSSDTPDEKEQEIMDFIEEQPGRFAGTAEVAEAFDMTTNGAAYRLKELRKEGLIQSRKPSRDEVWYIPATIEATSRGFEDSGGGDESTDSVGTRRIRAGLGLSTERHADMVLDVAQIILLIFLVLLMMVMVVSP